jgi:hypothetical protein
MNFIALMMEAALTSETSVDNYFTQQYIPEDKSELHTCRREKLIALMMEAARTSETSVDNYFTRQYIREDKSERVNIVVYNLYGQAFQAAKFVQIFLL